MYCLKRESQGIRLQQCFNCSLTLHIELLVVLPFSQYLGGAEPTICEWKPYVLEGRSAKTGCEENTGLVPWGRHDIHDKEGEDLDCWSNMFWSIWEKCFLTLVSTGHWNYYELTIIWFAKMKALVLQRNGAMVDSGSVLTSGNKQFTANPKWFRVYISIPYTHLLAITEHFEGIDPDKFQGWDRDFSHHFYLKQKEQQQKQDPKSWSLQRLLRLLIIMSIFLLKCVGPLVRNSWV